MSSNDASLYLGSPRLLFLFAMGDTRWCYASGVDQPVTHLSNEYQPEQISISGFAQSLNEDAPTATISLFASAAVCQQFVAYQPTSVMTVRVYRYHEISGVSEYRIDFVGEVVSSNRDEETGTCDLACRLVSSKLDRTIPWPVFQKPCNRALYSVGCGVNRDDFRVDAVLTATTGDELQSSAFATKEDGWFTAGYVQNPQGEVRFVVYHSGQTVILQTPFVESSPGDSVKAYAGCDLSRGVCKNKFNNYHRHLGFSWIPSDNPFKDNVYGANPNESAG